VSQRCYTHCSLCQSIHPYGTKEYETRKAIGAFKDPRGRDVLGTEAGLETLPMRATVGSFKERGFPRDTNPGRALVSEAPLLWTAPVVDAQGNRTPPQPYLAPDVKANLMGVAATHGAMLGQAGVGVNAFVPTPESYDPEPHFRMQMGVNEQGKPVTLNEASMTALADKYPKLIFAHAGPWIDVLNFGKGLTERQMRNVQAMAGAADNINAFKVGDYVNYASEWARKPGSAAVTQKMLNYIDDMTPEARQGLDQAMREPAGVLEQFYTQYAKNKKLPLRQDLMNLLRIMRDSGVEGVTRGDQVEGVPSGSGGSGDDNCSPTAISRAARGFPNSLSTSFLGAEHQPNLWYLAVTRSPLERVNSTWTNSPLSWMSVTRG
jgi:hypothetical protein